MWSSPVYLPPQPPIMTYKEYIVFNYDPFAIDTEEINQDDEKSEVAVFTRDTLIKDVRHTLVPIEYPATSDEGIAHMYHVENWTDSKAAFRDWCTYINRIFSSNEYLVFLFKSYICL
ncbi:unnamed protein product [Rhizophagus irregularis]|nr:unnamed protein product [Rhizophagus irregularis]